jgi:hypothetical protein
VVLREKYRPGPWLGKSHFCDPTESLDPRPKTTFQIGQEPTPHGQTWASSRPGPQIVAMTQKRLEGMLGYCVAGGRGARNPRSDQVNEHISEVSHGVQERTPQSKQRLVYVIRQVWRTSGPAPLRIQSFDICQVAPICISSLQARCHPCVF